MKKHKRKLLYKTPFLKIFKTNTNFYYGERKGINSIAALCFRKTKNNKFEFLIHFQQLPQIDENIKSNLMYPCPITGSFEKNDNFLTCAIREVLEEGGFKINKQNLIVYNKSIATTQMNEQIYHMLFDVTNLKQIHPITDGSYFESFEFNLWMSETELKKIIFDNDSIKISSLLVCYLLWKQHYKK